MARRKRLTPPDGPPSKIAPSDTGAAGTGAARPPIAQVSGNAALTAALDEVTDTLRRAESEGRLVREIPLDRVVDSHLLRDRIALDPDEMEGLKRSLATRGQQMPIEVLALDEGRFGLISGWRRCQALRELARDHLERPATVLALVRAPEDRAAAYVAMVEENEIRSDLSFFERARVVRRALDDGVFETEKQALQSLFANASWSRRSKIKSFLPVVEALDGALSHPARIPERLGLQLSRVLTGPEGKARARSLIGDLERAGDRTTEEERAVLEAWLGRAGSGQADKGAGLAGTGGAPARSAPPSPSSGGATSALRLSLAKPGKVVIEGPGVDDAWIARLRDWMAGNDRT